MLVSFWLTVIKGQSYRADVFRGRGPGKYETAWRVCIAGFGSSGKRHVIVALPWGCTLKVPGLIPRTQWERGSGCCQGLWRSSLWWLPWIQAPGTRIGTWRNQGKCQEWHSRLKERTVLNKVLFLRQCIYSRCIIRMETLRCFWTEMRKTWIPNRRKYLSMRLHMISQIITELERQKKNVRMVLNYFCFLKYC